VLRLPVAVAVLSLAFAAGSRPAASENDRYRPRYRTASSLEGVTRQLEPGHDAFPEEKTAAELASRLNELGALLRDCTCRAREAADLLLAPDFVGGRLTPVEETAAGSSPQLEVFRAKGLPGEVSLRGSAFRKELAALVGDLASVAVAEFPITGIAVEPGAEGTARTIVRFDVAGPVAGGGRAERLGRWQIRWRRGADGAWRVTEWTTLDHRRSHAAAPVFSEVTQTALGGNPSFQKQLVPGLDEWAAALDGVFAPGGMGHHGVSAGDYDGDGWDDLYVAQPDGLPNRLFRNRGDGTFEDVTEAAGLALLDRTSQSLFADVDNDGDQDLLLLTRSGPLLYVNDGRKRFARDAEAFRFEDRLQGTLTSAAMADYDRDGFLDLYLCAYGYFIGVSEDKAGPPTPYHDALNGSPNVLLRNDGHGRFVEVTRAVGLDRNNDRFSFGAAWGDYDDDGWPDLLVANDFGRKNLYRNLGLVNGQVRFQDVAAEAGVEDYGAGMSAAFVDYDNDGRLDVYTGNMWTAAGQRVTGLPGFMPDATRPIRDIYRRHVRGNGLFRNRGDGTFADVTLAAGAEFGRWAWSSDAFDFDSDGWDDLYVVNGMFTRAADEDALDVDSFFWRQVVAQSPLERRHGTAYDDGWRATNRLLVASGAQAPHERNVLLRNDGHGAFDDVSGSSGLDLDQDGRAFAVLDYDHDGDPDVAVMAPRSSPQLRLFRNDYAAGHRRLVVRLRGTKGNRDAVGARVTVETDRLRRSRTVALGSGFLSEHSRELIIGLGPSERVVALTVRWPDGTAQTFTDVPIDSRIAIDQGSDSPRSEPLRPSTAAAVRPDAADPARTHVRPGAAVWLYEPFAAPDFALRDLDGRDRSLSALAGRPAVLLFWSAAAPPSQAALLALARERDAFARQGATMLALALDPPAEEAKVRAAAAGAGVPVMIASEETAGAYNLLHRYLFDRREDLRLPTVLLLNGRGEVVKLYRDPMAAGAILDDLAHLEVPPTARLARAVPFPGTLLSPVAERNEFQYGLELSEQGYDGPALGAFERVAKRYPSGLTFYNLGTLYMKRGPSAAARAAFERALELQPDNADASNSLGALLAQEGDVPGAITRFKAALAARPDFADALNNLGFALFQSGQAAEAYPLFEKALAARPGFPEALNNLGIFHGRQGDLEAAQRYFQQAVDARPGYSEAANNLALVLAARGEAAAAVALLVKTLERAPEFEMTYVTLSRLYAQAGQRKEAVQVLERLLQRNPTHPLGLQMLRQLGGA
jgi:Tfp pilus assembly protein PilF/peroxiredoxin